MRFKIEELREPKRVEIKGDEPWLALIYQSFGLEGKADEPRLSGYFTLSTNQYGAFLVNGEISFTPKVNCGRCQLLIPWEIKRELKVRYLLPYKDEEGVEMERDLAPEDLDDYYIENGEIDVELSINDLVQTAIPNRLIKLTPDGKSCALCLENVEQAVVYEQKSAVESSPFAVLKDLNLSE